jgi:hypothetical protein
MEGCFVVYSNKNTINRMLIGIIKFYTLVGEIVKVKVLLRASNLAYKSKVY